MRIGLFSDSYIPYKSGVVTSIATTRAELERLGHQVDIFAPQYPGYKSIPGVWRYISLTAPSNRDFAMAVPIWPPLGQTVRKLDLDVIHVHSPFTMGLVGLHYARRFKLPLVFTYHTLYEQLIHYMPWPLSVPEFSRRAVTSYCTGFCRHCDHIVAPARQVEQFLKSRGVGTPISIVPSGVPLDLYNPEMKASLREKFNFPNNKKVVLNVGRLTREKNLFFLLRSFRKVINSIEDVMLVITADGPLEKELKIYANSLGLVEGASVVFTGGFEYNQLVDLYCAADIFMFASLIETQGLVLYEAMAAGLPVVAIRTSCSEEAIQNGREGYLTDPREEEFAEAVCRILNDFHRMDVMSENARKRAAMLPAREMALELESLYSSLAGEKVRTRRSAVNYYPLGSDA